jgi:hypothetical protein
MNRNENQKTKTQMVQKRTLEDSASALRKDSLKIGLLVLKYLNENTAVTTTFISDYAIEKWS